MYKMQKLIILTQAVMLIMQTNQAEEMKSTKDILDELTESEL